MVQHRLNRVRPCSAHPALLPKPELTLDLTEEALKIHPWWKLFSAKMQVQGFIKNELHHRDYLAWILQGTFFNILENFLQGITVISFMREVITTEKTRTSQLGLDIYNCVTGNADAIANAVMPMPRSPNALLSIYRGPLTLSNFQMTVSQPSKIRPSFPS